MQFGPNCMQFASNCIKTAYSLYAVYMQFWNRIKTAYKLHKNCVESAPHFFWKTSRTYEHFIEILFCYLDFSQKIAQIARHQDSKHVRLLTKQEPKSNICTLSLHQPTYPWERTCFFEKTYLDVSTKTCVHCILGDMEFSWHEGTPNHGFQYENYLILDGCGLPPSLKPTICVLIIFYIKTVNVFRWLPKQTHTQTRGTPITQKLISAVGPHM